MKDETKQKIKDLTYQIVILVIAGLAIIGAVTIMKGSDSDKERKNNEEIVVKVPENETPPLVDEEVSTTTKISSLELISPNDNYKVSSNPYSEENYKNNRKRLALIGNFEEAKLVVQASLPDNDYYFLSVNLGDMSGSYNAVRKSVDELDLELTKQSLGVFNQENPVNIAINLLDNTVFATDKQEFISTGNKTKLVRLWNYIKPESPMPSINSVLISLFNKNGQYNGNINSLVIEYSCKTGSDCKAGLCGKDELSSACLKRLFGQDAMDKWMDWYIQP